MADQNKDTPVRNGVNEDVVNAPEPDMSAQASDGAIDGEAADGAESVDTLKAELEDLRDRYLRQAAEYQNFRKRTAQERDSVIELGKVLVIERMLDVMDDLDRTMGAVSEAEQTDDPSTSYEALRQGVELVHRKFADELSRLNVEPIEAVGKPFDENLHDAMMQQPAPEGTTPGTVLLEIQKGYRMGERILRHSKVVVATEAAA